MKKNSIAANQLTEFPEGGPVKLARLPAAYVQRPAGSSGPETRDIVRRPFNSIIQFMSAAAWMDTHQGKAGELDNPRPTDAVRVRYARQSRKGWVGPSRLRCKADADARTAAAHRIPWASRYQVRPALTHFFQLPASRRQTAPTVPIGSP